MGGLAVKVTSPHAPTRKSRAMEPVESSEALALVK